MASEDGGSRKADGDRKDAGGREDDEGSGKPRSKKPLIIVAAVVAVLGIAGFFVWFARRNQVSTDDAYTDGNVVTMAPQVSGYVVELAINDNMRVKKGDLLLRIDPRDYLAAQSQDEAALELANAQLKSAQDALSIARVQYPAQLESAQAQLQSADAVFRQAERQYLRQHQVDRRATTQETIDASTSQQLSSAASLRSAKAQVEVARLVPEQIRLAEHTVHEREAQVKQAQAQLAQANLNLGYTEVRAPQDGFVTQRSVQLGNYLSPGVAMFLIVTTDVWVTANFKETQLGRMRPGDRVDLEIDAYSGYRLSGHVQSIQYGSGSRFSAFPAENATGNFVKIVQRVPVKIIIDRGLDPDRPLPLGLSVDPVVHFP
ncbi:MAG TPA: HlyD family secretion protein [Steroidobacteraceae bacterium]|jgi:membrane fusion protein (multidrug efflux system)|nr:HlyD family secretion protein [Steroidobacteraceae bacterium]